MKIVEVMYQIEKTMKTLQELNWEYLNLNHLVSNCRCIKLTDENFSELGHIKEDTLIFCATCKKFKERMEEIKKIISRVHVVLNSVDIKKEV